MSSTLIRDLHHVPDIIAALGLGIAEAQRRMDLAYVENLERLVVLAQSMLGGYQGVPKDPADPTKDIQAKKLEDGSKEAEQLAAYRAQIVDLLLKLAPARYQFTRTTLEVRLDLSQSFQGAAGLGVAAGVGAVAVNASMSAAYGYDYRAAARCETRLEAAFPDQAAFRALLDSVDKAGKGAGDLALPGVPQVEKDIQDSASKVFERMTGFLPAPVKTDGK
ncbi:hypothetical protein [Polyangium sp. y55x31]|uniref:hypothetical protein n=1 Tax=Polyangium sp. y55x31 TaxID=3042688 RepID=UPI00248229A7|nr:hypothetical protein [Polyangium sp. y55x31]MDI1478903.1 hypothetical protein [Polyangium sp. y55x31]